MRSRSRKGLSPRVRGNPAHGRSPSLFSGPIPACAGQPSPRPTRPLKTRAYPRVCGATEIATNPPGGEDGLSPRVRGNPPLNSVTRMGQGPIPACAGQPACATSQMRHPWAYPRVCGATSSSPVAIWKVKGLSPRVRGNPVRHYCPGLGQGPIPACAGQPNLNWHCCTRCRAYPRVCGATYIETISTFCLAGLSPRVRGNPLLLSSLQALAGPIPACAGQPGNVGSAADAGWAYPRVCGATWAKP